MAGDREQAKRIHDRIAGVPPSADMLDSMQGLVAQGRAYDAAMLAMQHPDFYRTTLKNWATPWTNEEFDIYAPLNDYSATVIGMVRDDIDFRLLLSGDILYVGDSALGVPAYNISDNRHYEALDEQHVDLARFLVATTQSSVMGLPVEATAGVMTSRAAAKAFFKDGTNRAMFRFTLINHMCTDLEGLKDTSLPPDRIRQDLSRSPGGDSRIFINSCVGCHSGMDPLAQAFAYYNYSYDEQSDPEGLNGRLTYNQQGQLDPVTGLRVQEKYWINANNFPFGYVTLDDRWDNYWREGINQLLGWSESLRGSGNGAKSMGQELAHSETFAHCQVEKVFEAVCLRPAQDSADRQALNAMTDSFKASGYQVKDIFANAADYCKGE
ncbi:hypothetical protein [Aestuariibacter salexigens]|uniref:hypothetical protein n=1 Tax=Aestuariibacter salexigens TaxID=226010 RepID=UPI0012EBDEB8|nr:hypothetical protein [Aestuariibacter salexigens]